MKKNILIILGLVSSAMAGAFVGILGTQKGLKKEIEQRQDFSDKHLEMFLAMNEWLKRKQKGENISRYFVKKGYRTIAIYGMGQMGERLLEELEGSGITVKYGIDRNKDGIYLNLPVVSPEEKLEAVDAIIVTPFHYFGEIEKKLLMKVKCPVISIEDILYNF